MAKFRRGQGSRSAADALARGGQGVQRAYEAAAVDRARGAQQSAQMGGAVSGAVQQYQAQENFKRQQSERERAQQESERMQQEGINLKAAEAGMVPDERMAALQQEMDQGAQRQKEQMGKPLELSGASAARSFRPSDETTALAKAKNEREQYKAETDRMRVLEYRRQNQIALARAIANGDKEKEQEALKNLQKEWQDSAKLYEKMVQGKASPAEIYKFTQEQGLQSMPDPQIQQELGSGEYGPRTQAAVKSHMGKALMQAIATGQGRLPENMSKVPMDSEAFASFQQHAAGFSIMLKADPAMAMMLGVTSLEDRNHAINQYAAQAVLDNLPPPAAPTTPVMGSTPSAGGQPATPPEAQPQQAPEVVPDEQSPGPPAGWQRAWDKYGAQQ